jgi:predicted dehydrogenase
MNRRTFLKHSAAVGAFTIVPSHVVGGVGHGQLQSCDSQGGQIVALCDVDDVYAKRSYDLWPQAKRYRDFRELLNADQDIDAVYCGTPDHSHAVIVIPFLQKKKHVCCVKPLTRTIDECRHVVAAAQKANVATQVTASPNSTDSGCTTCEMIWDGAIGDVHEVHIWSNRPLWPQGMLRPKGADPIPKNLDWDLWLGPAPLRPFKNEWPEDYLALYQLKNRNVRKAIYHPWNFRGWWQFGTGALGDMGCHHFNIPKKVLKLGHPTRVSASSTRVSDETAPLASIVTWEFPAREGMPPLKAVWYDGGIKPPRPNELESGQNLPDSGGELYIGSKGIMLGNRILPEAKMRAYKVPPKTLKRRSGTWGEWFEAMRGGETATCEFAWAGPLTEIVLLGNIAIRVGQSLNWDGPNMKFTNDSQANQLLKESYRTGWSL